MQKKKSKAFFERGSWYHRTKIIQKDGTVKYGKKGGFKTQEVGICINENPVTKAKKYPRKRNQKQILNKEQLKTLLQAASNDGWYLEILLGVFCGLTKGEILGLKFGDFDIEKRIISIERKMVMDTTIEKDEKENKLKVVKYNEIEKALDNINAYRKFKVPNIIIIELINRKKLVECWKSINKNYIDNDYVSCRNNGQLHSLTSLNAYFKKLCIKNSLPIITVNGLRHMFAVILLKHKISLVKISALLGHSSVNTTFEYLYDAMEKNREIMSFMNKNFC